MSNSILSYTDSQIMRCLLTHDFTSIGRRFEDDVITKIRTAAFYGAVNLDEVVLPSVVDIGSYAFYNTALTTLTLPWSDIESIGFMAFNQGFNVLPMNPVFSSLTVLGTGAFAGSSSTPNTQLRTVSLPVWTGSAPSGTGIGGSGGIFGYCTALTSVSAPLLTAIPNTMFSHCTAIETLTFPKVTSIGSSAFESCTKLTKIDIGGAVTSMTTSFLSSTTKLEAFILRGVTTVPTLGSNTFNNTNISKGTAYVYQATGRHIHHS